MNNDGALADGIVAVQLVVELLKKGSVLQRRYIYYDRPALTVIKGEPAHVQGERETCDGGLPGRPSSEEN